MQRNKPFETNPYINMNNNTNTQVPNQDLGLQNVNPYINQQNAVDPATTVSSSLLGSFDTQKFLLGALVGAAGVYLMTNEKAQKALFKTFAKGSAMFSAGIEEMKERYEDAQAELEAEHNA